MRLGRAYKRAPCWVSERTTRLAVKAGRCGAEALRVVFPVPGMIWSSIPSGRAGLRVRVDGCVPWGLVGGLWVVGWSLVENCTVDASILFSVVKLLRANGGCLGTRSR
jgi:hypothetical protein